MKSQKGLTLVQLVIMIIVLMLIAGVSTYVAMTANNQKRSFVVNPVNEIQEVNEVK